MTPGVCASCALCCRGTIPVRATDDIPAELVTDGPGIRRMRLTEVGDCVALDPDNRVCTIYDNRPAVCRAFEFDGPACRALRGLPLSASGRSTDV